MRAPVSTGAGAGGPGGGEAPPRTGRWGPRRGSDAAAEPGDGERSSEPRARVGGGRAEGVGAGRPEPGAAWHLGGGQRPGGRTERAGRRVKGDEVRAAGGDQGDITGPSGPSRLLPPRWAVVRGRRAEK